jgi:replicative DNA helicase
MQITFCGSTMWNPSPSRGRLHRAAAILDDQALHDLTTNNVFWDKIVQITNNGESDVYRVSVAVAQGDSVRESLEQPPIP